MNFLKKVQANKKTFTDYLFEDWDNRIKEIEEAKKEYSRIEDALRKEYAGRSEIDFIQELAYRTTKSNSKLPVWLQSNIMDIYDKVKPPY